MGTKRGERLLLRLSLRANIGQSIMCISTPELISCSSAIRLQAVDYFRLLAANLID